MTIQLMATCLVDSLFPEVGVAVLDLLHEAGEDVAFPQDQTCCGQPAFNAGFFDQARRMAQHTIEVFERSDEPVVIPSGSCTAMVRHGYPELFSDAPGWLERANELGRRTYELSQFLVDELGVERIGEIDSAQIAYHPSCHLLRGLGVERQPLKLLEAHAEADVERLAPECCGFGGTFSVEHPEISSEMLERRIEQIEASGAKTVVSCDVSCLMQLEGGLRQAGSSIRCAHIAQTLTGQPAGLR